MRRFKILCPTKNWEKLHGKSFWMMGSVIANNNKMTSKTPEEWKQELQKMEIWTTFERNFIFGYYMQTFATFASGMIFQAIPNLFASLVSGNIVSDLKTSGQVLNLANQR